MIRFSRWVYSIYSMYGVITSAWFLALNAVCFAWWVLGPAILSRLSDDETDEA